MTLLEKIPGAKIYYATTKAPQRYTDVRFEEDCYIMFGKESAGIPEEILLENQATAIRIPMIGDIRSLNLSNSVAIVLYEALRQHQFDHMQSEGHLTKYIHLVDRLMEEDYTSIDIAAALLKDHLSDVNADDIDALDDINLGGTELYGGEGEKMVRLFINAGKKSKIRAKDIVGAIANEAGIPGKTLGEIAIFDEYTFVDVPNEFVRDILHGMKHAKIKGKRVHIEIDKKRKTYGKKRK